MSKSVRLIQGIRGRNPIRPGDIARVGLGALIGIPLIGLGARLTVTGQFSGAPLLVAPIGASAVLALAVPASPLAQPRNVIGGNLIGAAVGVCCALLLQPWDAVAAGAAVALAIVAMALLGCLHPPGASVALGAVLAAGASSSPPKAWSYPHLLIAIGACSVLTVLTAMAYARLTGRSYPHRAHSATPAPVQHGASDAPPLHRIGFNSEDIDKALGAYGELLDVDREDLDALFREVELQAHRRIHAHIRCDEVMSRDVMTLDLHQSAASALVYLRDHDLRTAPVLDEARRVVGLARRAELQAAGAGNVSAAVDPVVQRVRESTAIEALLPILSSGEAHEAAVVDEAGVLVGIITQTDLLGVLYRAHIVEAVTARQTRLPGLSA